MPSENSTPAHISADMQRMFKLNEHACALFDTAALLKLAEESLFSCFESAKEGTPEADLAMRAAAVLRIAVDRVTASAEQLAAMEEN